MNSLFSLIKRNYVYILAGFAILIALVALLLGQSRPSPLPPEPIQIFTPSPTAQTSQLKPVSGEKYQEISQSDQEQLNKDSLVAQLIKKLPYQGTNFSLEYDYENNQFSITFVSGRQTEGDQEFDAFLKINQIQDRSWLKNLVIK